MSTNDAGHDAAMETGLAGEASLGVIDYLEPPEKWYFTFGFSHRLVVVDSDSESLRSGKEFRNEGISLSGKYIVLTGTREETRAKMIRLFGKSWAFQYDEAKAKEMIAKYRMKELKITL